MREDGFNLPASPFATFAFASCLALLTFASVSPAAAPVPADHAERMARGLVTFTQHVRPVLVKGCLSCHCLLYTSDAADE